MKVQDKVILVTGAGSGIGRALTLRLVDSGARVAAVDLNEDSLKETLSLCRDRADRVSVHVLNIVDQTGVNALPGAFIDAHGQIDGIVNNAGIIQPFVRFNDMDQKDIDRVINVNLMGVIHVTRAFLPVLLKRPEAHVVNVSSMGGFFPVPGQTLYGASKAAVKILTEGLYAELTDTPVGVTVAFPGAIKTNIISNSGLQMKHEKGKSGHSLTEPDEAARQIIEAIEKQRFQLYIGKDAKAMNWLYRLSPLWATRLMYRQMKDKLVN